MKTTGLGGTTATDLAGDDTHFMGIAMFVGGLVQGRHLLQHEGQKVTVML